MQIIFEDIELKRLIEDGTSKKYKKLSKDSKFKSALIDVYNIMRVVDKAGDLSFYSYLHYEKLKHIALSSVRVISNRVERLLFRETEDGLVITLIELNESHYGRKK